MAVAFLDLFMQFPIIAPFAKSLGSTSALTGIIVIITSSSSIGSTSVDGGTKGAAGNGWSGSETGSGSGSAGEDGPDGTVYNIRI